MHWCSRACNNSSSSSRWMSAIAAWLACCMLAAMSAGGAAASRHTSDIAARPHTWAYFNIHLHPFVGNWNNQTYQAEVWLRVICVNQTTHLARMVVSLHSAPFITVSPEGVHSLVPALLFEGNGSLPRIWFQSMDNDSMVIEATQLTNYDELIKRHEDAAQLMLGAELPASEPFTLRMEGSERVHMVHRQCGPKQHPLFTDNSAWLGIMDATTVTAAPNLKVDSRYKAEKPPPPPPVASSLDDALAQAVLQMLLQQSEDGSSGGGSSSSSDNGGTIRLTLRVGEPSTEAGQAAAPSSGVTADSLLQLLAANQAPAATAGSSGTPAPVTIVGDDAAAILQLLQAQQEQQQDQQQAGTSLADNMQMLQVLAQQQQAANAVAAALSTETDVHDQISSSSSSASSTGSKPGTDAGTADSSREPASSTDASNGSTAGSVDEPQKQRKLLSRSGLFGTLPSSNSSSSSSSISVSSSSNTSSSSSQSSTGEGVQKPEDVYFPFPQGNSSVTSSIISNTSTSGTLLSVDPATPLPPAPSSQPLGLVGDYSDSWAAEKQNSSTGSSGTASGSTAGPHKAAWDGISSNGTLRMSHQKRGEVLRFLTLQHLQHHRAIGFAGSIMVVTRHTADMIMESRVLRRAMQRQRLVLVLWDLGLEPRATHFMQVPTYNLLRLAAWGSNAYFGFWDLDEYLVVPSHKSVTEEIQHGCLSGALGKEPEAIVPTMWVSSNSWNATPELAGWMQHGYWSRAVQTMDYAMWPYTFCDGACKSFVNPNSDLMFQVHQHARPPPRSDLWPVSWRCTYLLHFYRLWSQRMPWLMSYMGYKPPGSPSAIPGIPLMMDDILPRSTIKRLASMAKLYKEIIASNPSLEEGGAESAGDLAALLTQHGYKLPNIQL